MLIKNRCGVVDKPLALYPRVQSSIPSSFSLSDETKPWPVEYDLSCWWEVKCKFTQMLIPDMSGF